MGYLNTFLYLNHEPDFHNIVEYESSRSEPVLPYLHVTTEPQTNNENNICEEKTYVRCKNVIDGYGTNSGLTINSLR